MPPFFLKKIISSKIRSYHVMVEKCQIFLENLVFWPTFLIKENIDIPYGHGEDIFGIVLYLQYLCVYMLDFDEIWFKWKKKFTTSTFIFYIFIECQKCQRCKLSKLVNLLKMSLFFLTPISFLLFMIKLWNMVQKNHNFLSFYKIFIFFIFRLFWHFDDIWDFLEKLKNHDSQ